MNPLKPYLAEEKYENTMSFNYLDHYKKDAEAFDYFEERTGATEHDERRVREYILSKTPKDNSPILDVGCGSAWVARHFTSRGRPVISLDISHINTVKALSLVPSDKHSAVVANSLQLPFPDNSISTIIASEVIEHIVEPAAFIKELFRVVKPGGELIITTPYKERIQYCLCIHCNQKTPLHAHLHSFSEQMLTGYYTGSDLQSCSYHIFGNKALIFLRTYTVLRIFPFWLWKLTDALFNKLIPKKAHILVRWQKIS